MAVFRHDGGRLCCSQRRLGNRLRLDEAEGTFSRIFAGFLGMCTSRLTSDP
jgi:hypothetical protein